NVSRTDSSSLLRICDTCVCDKSGLGIPALLHWLSERASTAAVSSLLKYENLMHVFLKRLSISGLLRYRSPFVRREPDFVESERHTGI
ncbi:MAG: hypothetical protein ACF8CY_05880, partial [Gimesia chilikensis]